MPAKRQREPPAMLLRFAGHRPRPFPLAAGPTSSAHERYGIERSWWRKLKAIVTRVPTLLKGIRPVGLAGLKTSNLMPADLLIDDAGHIVEAYYGRDAGDRISPELVEWRLWRLRGVRPARPLSAVGTGAGRGA